MASTKRQRELARQRAARQAAARQAAQQRKRRLNFIIGGAVGTVVIVVLVVVLVVANTGGSSKTPVAAGATPTPTAAVTATPTPAATASASPTADARPLACGITTAPAQAMVSHKFATAPATLIAPSTNYTMSITTNCGVITADLDATKAPKTVNSFFFLAKQKYFTGTECHRETNSGLFVLQCGDPTGTGAGGPGYTIPDENLTGATYPRGTLAMANSGANTNGSQFFLVDKDSQLGPQYTVFGKISAAGLATLDKIAALGIQGGATDGKPAQRIFIDALTLAKTA